MLLSRLAHSRERLRKHVCDNYSFLNVRSFVHLLAPSQSVLPSSINCRSPLQRRFRHTDFSSSSCCKISSTLALLHPTSSRPKHRWLSTLVDVEPKEEGEESGEEPTTDVPGACWPVDPQYYEEQLAVKLAKLRALFADRDIPEIEVFRSPPLHYRSRAEFKISRKGGKYHYVMNDPIKHHRVKVEHFPTGSLLVNKIMVATLQALEQHPVLADELFCVRLHGTLSGQAMVTFLYREPIHPEWTTVAQAVRTSSAERGLDVSLIGRSRKLVEVVGNPYVDEVLNVRGKNYAYRQYESEFSQPNATVNQHMLGWAQEVAEGLNLARADLVELYCGNGNFTLPVATHFRRVLATELSHVGIKAAKHNLVSAKLTNVTVAQMCATDFSKAVRNIRRPPPFVPKDRFGLASYDFQTVLLDPPRPGADAGTLSVLKDIPNVIYISCNPVTLHANLDTLRHTHRVCRFAAFDQFPYTNHIECGVLLGPKLT